MDKPKDNAAAAAKGPAGLEGVVAASSSIGDVDGINGVLIYQGYNIHDLAEHSTFEEVVFLLWHGRLPKRAELDELRRAVSENQTLPTEVVEMMRRFPKEAEPMDALRTAVSALAFYDKGARAELSAIWGSAGFLEIAAYCQSAADLLGARRGQKVLVIGGR